MVRRLRSLFSIGVLLAGCRFGFDSGTSRDAAAPDPDADGDAVALDAEIDASTVDAPGPDTGPASCPSGYVTVVSESSKYRAVNATSDWLGAEQDCETDGTHLWIPDSANEGAQMVVLVPAQNLWVGVTDRKVLAQWLRVTGGIQTYLPWGNNEPSAAALECVVFDGNTTQLGDQGCNSGHRYVCECDGAAAVASTY